MKTWGRQHARALAAALCTMRRAPLGTALSAIVVGIALALPAGGEMLLSDLLRIRQQIAVKPQISVFMELAATQQEVADAEERLRRHAEVLALRHVGRDATLQRYRETEGVGELVAALAHNPFPDAFIVSPRSEAPRELEQLKAEFAKLPRVEHVQLDSAWAGRLDAFGRLGRRAVVVLAALLGAALIAVTFNTIRLQILTQRAEIEVSRLLGASDSFIRRPFLYFGMLQGLLGGLIALGILWGAAELLAEPVREVAKYYSIDSGIGAVPLPLAVLVFGTAMLLGWLGARLSVIRYLREAEGGSG